MYDSLKLFDDDKPIVMTVKTDLKKLLNKKSTTEYLGADYTVRLPDSSVVTERVRIRARGNFRRQYCYIPPIKLNFKNKTSPKLAKLDELELTNTCRPGTEYEQLVYKEYLVYKIYNVLTPKSQRVRLVTLTLEDSAGKKSPIHYPAFFLEDFDAVAKRNKCKEVKIDKLHTENTDREQMTLVAIFEYMIGNTDWSVYANHNIKLIQGKDSTTSKPYAVAYDFDYAGLVNAPYAVPDEQLGIPDVRTRVYRGFPREMKELKDMSKLFLEKKDSIYATIKDCTALSARNREEMLRYLDDFYQVLIDDRKLKGEFIENARQL